MQSDLLITLFRNMLLIRDKSECATDQQRRLVPAVGVVR